MLLNKLQLHTPKTLSEACTLLKELDNVKIQAGGTFLLNALKLLKRKGAKTPDHVIGLSKIEELKGIEADEESLKIKAMTTIDDLKDSESLDDNFSILKTVCKNISTQPIRNMATVGGNLTCRYTWTEMPAAMIGLNANLHFINTEGDEESLSAEEFFKNQAKTKNLLTHIMIKREPSASIAYRRVRKTQFVDIPLLSLMIKSNIEDNNFTQTRAAINNCVQFAQRDIKLENFLNGKSSSNGIAKEALDHLEETIYDTRSTDYKSHMFRVSVKEAIEELCEGVKC